jgi:hypothetical protein
VSESTVCGNFRVNGTMPRPTSTELFFGDIAIRDGIVYGHMAVDNDTLAVKFFTIDLDDCAYQEWQQTYREQLQLAWVGNTLYGHSAGTGLFWVVDPSNGSRTAGPTYSPLVMLSDIAGTYTPVVAPEAGLAIVKMTNGTDNNDPTGPYILVGDPVTWTYRVTNTGNVTLTSVTVTDNQLPDTDISCPGSLPGFSNVIPSLAPGAANAVTCTATGIAQAGQYANIGTATTTYNGGSLTVTDPDHYFGWREWQDETATGFGTVYPNTSNWFMYTAYTTSSVRLVAGRDHQHAGNITMSRSGSGPSTITTIRIELLTGWRWASVPEVLKIQPFASRPSDYLEPGAFQYKFTAPNVTNLPASSTALFNGRTVTVTMRDRSSFYGIHGDVERFVPMPP